MTTGRVGLLDPTTYLRLIVRDPPTGEVAALRRIADELRSARRGAGLSRGVLAARLGIALDVLVALENGYGSLDAARSVLGGARRLCGSVDGEDA